MATIPVVVPGITNKAYVDFTGPYPVTGQEIITPTATVASAADANLAGLLIAPATITLTGTTQVTTAQGAVTVGIVTLTDTMAVTVDSYSSLYVAGTPVASGSVTATDLYAVNVAAGRSLFVPTRTAASATSAELAGLHVGDATLTVTGTTQITTATGFVRVGTYTVTDASAVTIDTLAAVYIAAAPVAAGMVTLTAAYALWVDSGNVRLDGNLTVSGGTITLSAAATTIVLKANTASDLLITDGTTSIIAIDTRNTVTAVTGVTISAAAPTITAAAGVVWSQSAVAAKTVTLTGSTGVTAMDGIALNIGTQTITDSSAETVTTASALYVKKLVAGGMITITNNYIINTDVAGCFLTAAGVWTDASSREHKEQIADVVRGVALKAIQGIRDVTYRYKQGHDDGMDTVRFGVIAEELPDIVATTDHKGLSTAHMVGLLLAGLKDLAADFEAYKAQHPATA